MGSWEGAELADLVGLYILSKLAVFNIQIGLYRDNSLAVIISQAERTYQKEIMQADEGLRPQHYSSGQFESCRFS